MALTLAQAFEDALKLISRYSNNGTVLPPRMVADLRLKRFALANNAQMELAKISKIPAVLVITANPIAPVSGSSFTLVQHVNDDVILMETTGALAYSLEVDSEATIYVEEETSPDVWSTVKTISVASTVTSFTNYRGKLTTADPANSVRIRLSGSYPYNVQNYAMWDVTFKADANVPTYTPMVQIPMPTGFMELNERYVSDDTLILDGVRIRYDRACRAILIPHDLKGIITIHYFKFPTEINSSTSDSATFELVDELAISAIPYYMAAMMVSETMVDVSAVCMARYNEIRTLLMTGKGNTNRPEKVSNSVFGRKSYA